MLATKPIPFKQAEMKVNLTDAEKLACLYFKCGLVPMVVSEPGVGKSSMFANIADKFELLLIDIRLSQCDTVDLNGFPDINTQQGIAKYIPFDMFPTEDTELPINPKTGRPYRGFLLFLDELTHAEIPVQKAAYKLILDKMVGMKKLHKSCSMAAAGNLITDNSFVEPMTPTTQSRLVHIQLKVDAKSWLKWAVDEGDIDHRILSYINYKEDNLMAYDPMHTDMTFACPRTWEFASRVLKHIPEVTRKDKIAIAGCIGVGIASDFVAFCQIYEDLITVDDIAANPSGVRVPDQPAILYALTGTIAHKMDTTNVDALMLFLSRIKGEFQMITMKSVVKRKPELMSNPAVQAWCARFNSVFG